MDGIMKRAFSTVACMKASWKEIADQACRAGMEALEIRLYDDDSILGLQEEELPGFLEYLSEKELVISDLGTSVTFFDYEPDKLKRAKRAVRLAAQVRAKGIRVFLTPFVKRHSDSVSYCYDGIAAALKELCAYSQQYDVEIWVETHNEFSTGKSLNRLLQDVDADNLKVIWDIMHPIEKGESPEETLRFLNSWIAHVHIKDGRKSEDSDRIDYLYTELGGGELPVREIVQMLKAEGYCGYLSLEWETAWRSELQGIYSSLEELLVQFNLFMDRVES